MGTAFGKVLYELRMRDSTAQQTLANHLHVDVKTVSKWEAGTREPSYEMLSRIADYFQVSTDVMLGREPIPAEAQRQFDMIGRAYLKEHEELFARRFPQYVVEKKEFEKTKDKIRIKK